MEITEIQNKNLSSQNIIPNQLLVFYFKSENQEFKNVYKIADKIVTALSQKKTFTCLNCGDVVGYN